LLLFDDDAVDIGVIPAPPAPAVDGGSGAAGGGETGGPSGIGGEDGPADGPAIGAETGAFGPPPPVGPAAPDDVVISATFSPALRDESPDHTFGPLKTFA
jgi:hypothetical protein